MGCRHKLDELLVATQERIKKELATGSRSMLAISKQFGVSDTSVKRWWNKVPVDERLLIAARVRQPLLEQIKQRRLPYFQALKAWGDRMGELPLDALASFPERARVDRLVAAAFSIVAEAAGKPENFASDHPNIRAMMNTYQNLGSLAPYAQLLTTVVENTSQRALLKGKVGEHLQRSITSHRLGHVEQVNEASPEWRLLRELLPEALDPFIRQRLIDAGALPAWASS